MSLKQLIMLYINVFKMIFYFLLRFAQKIFYCIRDPLRLENYSLAFNKTSQSDVSFKSILGQRDLVRLRKYVMF